jgi:hypothetical protein
MELHDQRLSFARDLVGHWSHVRSHDRVLVPSERHLDFSELQRIIPKLSIMDSPAPDASIVAVMGKERIDHDLLRTIKRTNWFDLLPPAARDLAERARKSLIERLAVSTIVTPPLDPRTSCKRRKPWSSRCAAATAKRRPRRSPSRTCCESRESWILAARPSWRSCNWTTLILAPVSRKSDSRSGSESRR